MREWGVSLPMNLFISDWWHTFIYPTDKGNLLSWEFCNAPAFDKLRSYLDCFWNRGKQFSSWRCDAIEKSSTTAYKTTIKFISKTAFPFAEAHLKVEYFGSWYTYINIQDLFHNSFLQTHWNPGNVQPSSCSLQPLHQAKQRIWRGMSCLTLEQSNIGIF